MIENVSQGQEFSGIISVKKDTFLSIRFREVEIITILTKSPKFKNVLTFFNFNPGLGRIFQTRHGSEIQCVCVSHAETTSGRSKKALDASLPGGSGIFLLLATSCHDSVGWHQKISSSYRVEPAL